MNERALVDALQDCLEQIEAGRSPESALERHPELRRHLAPRLQTALSLRAYRPGRVPAFDRVMRRRLAAVDAERAAAAPLGAGSRWRAPLLRAAALILAAGLALGTASYAAAAVLPADHWLQPVVQRIERVRTAILDSAAELLTGSGPDEGAEPAGSAQAARTEDAAALVALPSGDPSPAASRASDTTEPRGPAMRSAGDREAAAPRAGLSLDASPTAMPPTATAGATEAPLPAVTSALVVPAPTLPPTREPSPENPAPTATPSPPPASAEPLPSDPPPPEPTRVPAPLETPPGPPPPPTSTPVPPDAPGAISGTVRSKRGGEPVSGFELDILVYASCPRWGDRASYRTRSDRDGRFRVEGLAPAAYYVAVVLPGPGGRVGFAWHPAATLCAEADAVQVEPGRTREGTDILIRERSPGDHERPPGPGRDPEPGRPPRDPGGEPSPSPEPTSELAPGS